MPTKQDWLDAISNLEQEIGDFSQSLDSPQFKVGNWRIGTEHQRSFKQIVIRWDSKNSPMPTLPDRWVLCPPSDQKKNWKYRTDALPSGLQVMVNELVPPVSTSLEQFNLLFDQKVEKSFLDSTLARQARLKVASVSKVV